MGLQYKIDVLNALKEKGFNTNKIRTEGLLSQSTLQKFREKKGVSWENLETLCSLLECQPGDLLEYVKEQERAAMFGDTDLPLVLIMEEILGWEKKPQDNEQDEQKTTDKQK